MPGTVRWVRQIARGGPFVSDLAIHPSGEGSLLMSDRTLVTQLVELAGRALVVARMPVPANSTAGSIGHAGLTYRYEEVITSSVVLANSLVPRTLLRLARRFLPPGRMDVEIPVPNAFLCATYHLNAVVPPGLFVAAPRIEALSEEGRRTYCDPDQDHSASEAHVHVPAGRALTSSTVWFRAQLGLIPTGVGFWTALVSGISTFTILLSAYLVLGPFNALEDEPLARHALDKGSFSQVAGAAFLLLPGLAAGLLIAPTQHDLSARLLRRSKVRLAWTAFASLMTTLLLAIWSADSIGATARGVGFAVAVVSVFVTLGAGAELIGSYRGYRHETRRFVAPSGQNLWRG